MKRFAFAVIATAALVAPSIASAQGVDLVYRPELRGLVAVPKPLQRVEPAAPIVARTFDQEIAHHQTMAAAFRGTKIAQAAAHCDSQVAQAREARKQF
jgi:hypothetical protein